MALVWLSLRVRWRRAWLASLGLGLLIGTVGAFVMASTASARRVEGAYEALLAEIRAPDLIVMPRCGVPAAGLGCAAPAEELSTEQVVGQLRQLDVVDDVRAIESVLPYLVDAGGDPLLGDADDEFGCIDDDRAVSVLALSEGGPHDQPMPFRLDGRMPAVGSHGAVLTNATAAREGLARGDSVFLAGWCSGDGDPVIVDPIELEITGLSIGPLDIEPPGTGLAIEPAYIDRSVFQQLVAHGAEPQTHTAVWIDPTADPAVVSETLAGYDIEIDLGDRAANFDSVLASDARLLWLLAGVGAASGLLLLGPLITANLRTTSRETPVLVALGSSRKQLASQAVAHVATLALIATVPAAALTAPISALMPRGFATAIDPDRRLWFDTEVTLAGAALLIIVVVALAALPAWAVSSPRRQGVIRSHPDQTAPGASPRRGWAVGVTNLRPSIKSGVQAAVGVPAGPRVTSPWPSLISLTITATTCIASLTYLSGLDRLESEKSLVGWNWDAVVSFEPEFADQVPAIIEGLRRLEGVEQVTTGTLYPPALLFEAESGASVWPWSFDTGPGAITPTMLSGRAPSASNEVAIDDLFARQAGLAAGDTVTLVRQTLASQMFEQIQDRLEEPGLSSLQVDEPEVQRVVADFEITGRTVLPLQRTQDMAQAAFTLSGLAEFVEPDDGELQAALDWLPDALPPVVQDDVDDLLANLDIEDRAVYLRATGDHRRIADEIASIEGVGDVVAPSAEQVLTLIVGLNLSRTDRVPSALLNVISGAAAILLIALLIVSIRARHLEIAIMRTLGLASNGVRWSIAAHATVTAIVPLVVAVPGGVAVGRWAWTSYARDLDVGAAPVTPWMAVGLAVLGAVFIANASALASSRSLVDRSLASELRAG